MATDHSHAIVLPSHLDPCRRPAKVPAALRFSRQSWGWGSSVTDSGDGMGWWCCRQRQGWPACAVLQACKKVVVQSFSRASLNSSASIVPACNIESNVSMCRALALAFCASSSTLVVAAFASAASASARSLSGSAAIFAFSASMRAARF